MGQQSNKVQKRRRRSNYLDRKKAKVKAAAANVKPATKKKPAPKKEKVAAAEPAAE